MNKWTATKIRQAKGRQRIACLTAYDYATARIVDEAGLPLILVGDSLGMAVLGYDTTLPVTMEQMLHHTAAVARGAHSALVVGDMPFMSYQVSDEQALNNAARFLRAGAAAVKLEGGAIRADLTRKLVANGVPVLGHIGLTPQSVLAFGGFKVQGRQTEAGDKLVEDARALAEAGAFAVVVECVPAELGRRITAAVPVPTIGIGAGPHCDGQVLVLHDMLGLTPEANLPRFVKRYADLDSTMRQAVSEYAQEVESGRFPEARHSYE